MSVLDDLRREDGSPDADEIVEEFWAYDGPHTPAKIRAAAWTISRLVRYINNATQYERGPGDAPSIGRVLGAISGAVYGLDQLLDQHARAAQFFAEDPTLYDDRAPRAQGGTTARELAKELQDARHAARRLAHALDQACGLAGRLGHRSEGE